MKLIKTEFTIVSVVLIEYVIEVDIIVKHVIVECHKYEKCELKTKLLKRSVKLLK